MRCHTAGVTKKVGVRLEVLNIDAPAYKKKKIRILLCHSFCCVLELGGRLPFASDKGHDKHVVLQHNDVRYSTRRFT